MSSSRDDDDRRNDLEGEAVSQTTVRDDAVTGNKAQSGVTL